jgi:hypothetical protein
MSPLERGFGYVSAAGATNSLQAGFTDGSLLIKLFIGGGARLQNPRRTGVEGAQSKALE